MQSPQLWKSAGPLPVLTASPPAVGAPGKPPDFEAHICISAASIQAPWSACITAKGSQQLPGHCLGSCLVPKSHMQMALNRSIHFLTSHLPGSRGWGCHSHDTWANRRGMNLGSAPRPVRRDRSTSAPTNPSCQKTFLWAGIWQPVCKRSL